VVQRLRGAAQTLSTQLDTARTYPQVRYLKDMRNPLELPFRSPSRKVQDPSQSPEPATNNHQHVLDLHRCSKPSRWRQPPRVIRTLQPQQSSSVTRCNHSSKCTRNHSQSHFNDESRMEMSGSCLLRLTKMSSISKCQEGEPWSRLNTIYRALKEIEPLGLVVGLLLRDRTCRSG
jgi:hypothetical protein